ncbi:MAG TPA: hypothetical protein VGU27_11240, partial [Candidatus Eisenbacteria bacterium]|nr:hypothetical protein [Candidatus Eisenbacteria bacterium]
MSAPAAWPAAAPERPPAPAAAAPTTALDAAAWRGDVRFLRAAIDSLHPQPYRRHPRAAWDSAATALARRLPSLPAWDAVGAISAFVALLGDGHSRLDQVRLEAHTRPTLAPLGLPGMDTRYPVGFAIHADGLWIERARAPYEDLVGARVVAIGGRPVAAAVAALAPLISADNRMWTLYVLPEYLRAPGYACAAGLVPDPGAPL